MRFESTTQSLAERLQNLAVMSLWWRPEELDKVLYSNFCSSWMMLKAMLQKPWANTGGCRSSDILIKQLFLLAGCCFCLPDKMRRASTSKPGHPSKSLWQRPEESHKLLYSNQNVAHEQSLGQSDGSFFQALIRPSYLDQLVMCVAGGRCRGFCNGSAGEASGGYAVLCGRGVHGGHDQHAAGPQAAGCLAWHLVAVCCHQCREELPTEV